MTDPSETERARSALAGRLRAIAAVQRGDLPEHAEQPAEDAARVLLSLVRSLGSPPSNSEIWLLLAGISAAYPDRDDVDEARREVELSDPEDAARFLLEFGLSRRHDDAAPLTDIQVVTGRVLVEVDFTARHDLHTGIQRVVRQTVPLWNMDRDITPVAWDSSRQALRLLDPVEAARIYDWSNELRHDGQRAPRYRPGTTDHLVLIPWNSVLVLPEVPAADVAPRIAALGACSNNRVVAIGYDTIPLVSAETVPIEEPTKFMPYLSSIKFADRVAGISDTAAEEFRSFTAMLPTQGLQGPVVVSVPLPAELGDPGAVRVASAADPTVVVVGSHDPRKNHLAILHAAEMLWQQGLRFALTFIGGGGSSLEFYHRVEVLQMRGRPVDVHVAVPEAELRAAVAASRFTVFPSVHEGYGLPVAESLALGVPVITTNYGSTAEIAAGGGALTVDPRDDAELASAMRRLLTDDAEIDRLRAEIGMRHERSWLHYADELWDALVAPVLRELAGPHLDEGR